MRDLICQDCGKLFQAGGGNYKFCSECRSVETKEGRHKRYLRNRENTLVRCRRYQLAHVEQRLAYMRRWYQANIKRLRVKSREYDRKFKVYLKSAGKAIRIKNKRLCPINGQCELCQRFPNRLVYHHWTDEHPEWGVWLCTHCHLFTERIEQGKHQEYLKLKTQVERAKHGT